jgi:hypothetical protein
MPKGAVAYFIPGEYLIHPGLLASGPDDTRNNQRSHRAAEQKDFSLSTSSVDPRIFPTLKVALAAFT